MPQIKGQIKPMMNAMRVGSTNTGQYLLMAFCMMYLLYAEWLTKKGGGANFFARLPVQFFFMDQSGA